VLLSSALFSLICLAAVVLSRMDALLVWALAAHAVVLFAAGLGLRVLAVSARIEGVLRRRFPKLAPRLADFHVASRDTRLLEPKPLLLMFGGRAAQTMQYAVLAHAAGISLDAWKALAVQGVNFVAAAVGVFVPGQIGSAELVFRYAGEALGTTPANALALALLARIPQFTFIALGLTLLAFWSPRAGDEREADQP
jgi:Lysylphosphatidylglycerol synthase TM region